MSEGVVDLIDFGGEKGAAVQSGEVRQGGIFGEQRTEFLPGWLGLNEGEVARGQLRATETLIWLIHCMIDVFFDGTKVQKNFEICKEKWKYFWYNVD